MSACPVPVPGEQVKVLILAKEPIVAEPLNVVGLFDRELDTKETTAIHAAYLVGCIIRQFLSWLDTLEEAKALLAKSAATSTRATTAHDHFRNAAELAEAISGDLMNAKDALEFHWPGRQATRTRRGPTIR